MPLKSGIRFSTPVSGLSSWMARTVSAYSQAPPSSQVVAGDAGDGGVAQLHLLDRLRDPARLVTVERLRLAGVDLAEVAAARALVAADEERRLAVLPALEDVGAARLLADRVQTLGLHQALERGVLRSHLRPGLDPGGLPLDRGLCVADLETEELTAFGDGGGHVGKTTPAVRFSVEESCSDRPVRAHRVAGTTRADAAANSTRPVPRNHRARPIGERLLDRAATPPATRPSGAGAVGVVVVAPSRMIAAMLSRGSTPSRLRSRASTMPPATLAARSTPSAATVLRKSIVSA